MRKKYPNLIPNSERSPEELRKIGRKGGIKSGEARRKNRSKAVKKTLSIPEWLNEAAIRENLNFSQILQEALMVKLGVNGR